MLEGLKMYRLGMLPTSKSFGFPYGGKSSKDIILGRYCI